MNSGISIVVPTFNRTELLFETLQSVKNQASTNWECLIVDDGSTEEHIDAIGGWIGDDIRFKLIQRSGGAKGAPACRNIGWKSANHDLVMFLDSDDLISEDCIANRENAAVQKPEMDFWVFSTLLFDKEVGDTNLLLNVMTVEDPVSRFLKMDVIWLTSGVLWKKDSLVKLGGWDEKLLSWQDWDLNLRSLLANYRYSFNSRVDNYFRVRSSERESIGRDSFSRQHLLSHEKLADKTCSLVDQEPRYVDTASYLYFWIADQWVQQGELSQALRVWKSAFKFHPMRRYLINKLRLIAFAAPVCEGRLRKVLRRRRHPGLSLWTGTFKRVRYFPEGSEYKPEQNNSELKK